MTGALQNQMRKIAEQAAGNVETTRLGVISAYDPDKYAVKAILQPEGTETGWMALASPWIGNGWGLFAGPSPDDQIEITYHEGQDSSSHAGQRLFSAKQPPVPVPSGEFLLRHKSGSLLWLHNDGSVELEVAAGLKITVAGETNGSAAAWKLKGDLTVDGNITASQQIRDQSGQKGSMQDTRNTYDGHTHSIGSGSTAAPSQRM